MAKRLKIGLFVDNSDLWTGGLYYIINIVHALKSLPKEKQPWITLFYKRDFELTFLKEVNYPFIDFVDATRKYSVFERVVNKICYLFSKRLFFPKKFRSTIVDVIYPNAGFHKELAAIQNQLWWIPDFQEKYYPDFFTLEELTQRNEWQGKLAANKTNIVFSSQNALNDFKNFFPQSAARLHLVRFAVSHSTIDFEVTYKECSKIYNLPQKYFLVANQLWKHKNHSLVIEAMEPLSKSDSSIRIVFTGKESDYRDPNYPVRLKEKISEKGLQNNFLWLGFIPKDHMLTIMNYAHAVIQPSLFEGWSTVIEDGKSLGKQIIASDFPVHVEQLGDKGLFFQKNSAGELALQMKIVWAESRKSISYDYESDVIRFGRDFLDVATMVKVSQDV
jgi:glycosyltransferase involved in cell wall biosynthesis